MNRRGFIKNCGIPAALYLTGCDRRHTKQAQKFLMDLDSLYEIYRSTLLDDIVPFWETFGVDRKYGGLLTCLTDDGELVSDEKYTYSVARGLWTFSALYNMVENRESWLRIARETYQFLTKHARDNNGDWVYSMNRNGSIKQGSVSIWSDCFACYGLIEYARATGNEDSLELAKSTLLRIVERTSQDDFDAIAPFTMTPGVMKHGISMMLIVLSDEYLLLQDISEIQTILHEVIDRVMNCHLDREQKLLFETVGRDCKRFDTPEGRFVLPGHAIESMWKILRSAARTQNRSLIQTAAETMKWHLEAGWDDTYGGIVYSLDSSGSKPDLPPYPQWDLKMWWVHTEALYGTLLAYELTGEDWCIEWYNKIHEYAFSRYPAGPGKDWHERLTRDGTVMKETVNLPVKDFFHTPRMCLYAMESLDRMRKNGEKCKV